MKKNGKKSRADRRRARAWMVMNRLRPCDIQRAIGDEHHSQVVETLNGVRDHRRTLRWLMDKGCPAEYLELPEGMIRDAAKEK